MVLPTTGEDPLRFMSLLVLGAALSACASNGYEVPAEVRKAEWEAQNLYPRTYRAEVIAYLRTYLNDPTGLTEAAISEPVLKPMGLGSRYVSCLRFHARHGSGEPGSAHDHLVVFVGGKLDAFKEGKDECGSVAYVPFPELETLRR
jgi:hypothetical protein